MPEAISNLAPYRCLVIDDFQGMRTMLRDMLRECGATRIDVAANGREASPLLQNNNYDIVLCDYNLGAGKNGQQLLEEARVREWAGPACAWVMVTAEKTPDAVLGAVEYQPDGYLIKPVTSALLLNRLGKILARKADFLEIDKAVRRHDFLQALSLCDAKMAAGQANAGELLRWKGQMLIRMGSYEPARALFEGVLAGRDLPWAIVGLGKVEFHQGNYLAARDLFERVIADNRAHIEAYDWLARTQELLGEAVSARETLQRAAQLSPNSPVRQKNLGELALQTGEMELAEAAFRKSMAVGEHSVLKTPDSVLGLARVYGKKGQPEEAARVLAGIGKQFAGDEVLMRAKAAEGLIYQQNGQAERAGAAARELAEILKQADQLPSVQTSIDAAGLLLTGGFKEAGVALLQSVVKNNHDNPDLMAKVQQAFDAAGLHEEGTHLVARSKREATEQMNEGVLLARGGKLSEAVAAMRRAKAAMPSNVRVLLNCAHVMILSLQKQSMDPAVFREAQQTLLRANMLAPGEERFSRLMRELEALKAAYG